MRDDTQTRARKYLSLVMRSVSSAGQNEIAKQLEVSEATISRFVSGDLERACHVIAAAGLQVAPFDAVVVSQSDIKALERMAYKYLQSKIEPDEDSLCKS